MFKNSFLQWFKLMEKAILFGVKTASESGQSFANSMEELKRLSATAGAVAADVKTQSRERPDPAYFAGKGRMDEIKKLAARLGASAVIFDNILKPSIFRPPCPFRGGKTSGRTRPDELFSSQDNGAIRHF